MIADIKGFRDFIHGITVHHPFLYTGTYGKSIGSLTTLMGNLINIFLLCFIRYLLAYGHYNDNIYVHRNLDCRIFVNLPRVITMYGHGAIKR